MVDFRAAPYRYFGGQLTPLTPLVALLVAKVRSTVNTELFYCAFESLYFYLLLFYLFSPDLL